jgi:hypothetical protein
MRADTCESVRAHLGALVDGELPGRQRLSVLAHVDACGRCAGEVDELRGLGAELRESAGVQSVPALSGLASSVIGRVRAERAQSWGAMFERAVGDWHWVVVGAGSILATTITTSIVWLVLWFGPAPVRQDSLAALIDNLTTSPGSLFLVVSPNANPQHVTLVQITDPASLPRAGAVSMRMSERELVDALANRLASTGWRPQLHSMAADQRQYVESLLDEISRPHVAVPTRFNPQITVREVHLVTETSVTAKGL